MASAVKGLIPIKFTKFMLETALPTCLGQLFAVLPTSCEIGQLDKYTSYLKAMKDKSAVIRGLMSSIGLGSMGKRLYSG